RLRAPAQPGGYRPGGFAHPHRRRVARRVARARPRAGRAVQLGAHGRADGRGLPGGGGVTPGIVIVTYECREFALRCLDSIARELPGALSHVVVVDNASKDGTPAAVSESFPAVKVVVKHRNVGFAAGANTGMRALPDCDVIALL